MYMETVEFSAHLAELDVRVTAQYSTMDASPEAVELVSVEVVGVDGADLLPFLNDDACDVLLALAGQEADAQEERYREALACMAEDAER